MSKLEPYRFSGGTAVLTGAASGIGEQLAYGLASRGSNVVLIDRDAERLGEVAAKIRSEHPELEVDTLVADLADIAGLPAITEQILAKHSRLTLLINNAGVAIGGRFTQLSAEDFDWVMDVNFRAPVALTRLLLPSLAESPGSHIVNVSSLFGLIAPPGQSAYSSSKFALRGFSEALRHELAEQQIGVTRVHPGGIRTRIAESAKVGSGVSETEAAAGKEGFAKLLTYPADKAAGQILAGVEKRKGRVLIAISAVVPDLLARLLPVSYMDVMNKISPSGARNARSGVPAAKNS